MKATDAILMRWRREDPDRLLQAALRQARELAELVPELDGLRSQNATLRQQLEIQTKRMAQLEEALQEAERAAHRQVAPFRIEEKKRVLTPKPPGRKLGHPGAFRHQPDHIDEAIEAQLCACPHCGASEFIAQSRIEQLIEDIPPVRPHVTRLTTFEATCARCGQNVRYSHPLQMSLAIGAAGVQLGPRALALAADLNKAKGLSMRLAIYDDATTLKQKCYAHHLKAIRQAKALHPHQGEGLTELSAMLRAALALQGYKAECDPQSFHDLRQALERKAVQLLDSPRSEPSEEAVRNRLQKQRDHLFTFLDHDGVEPTNNLAERQLRPALIARKISCGNKTLKGARTWQILASLAATCAQRASSFIAELARAAPLQAR